MCLTLGLIAGVFSGLIGIGGATILIPAMVLLFGFSQHQAQGTTLGLMMPPIGLLAAYTYYQAGHINLKVAALVCIGFFIGGLIGARMAIVIPEEHLRRMFALFLLVVAIRMMFVK